MKSRLALAIVICVLVVSVFAVSYAGYNIAYSAPSYSFTLTAQGSAYDLVHHKDVVVTLSLTGNADGKLSKLINLHIKGGSFSVAGYGSFSVSSGGYGIVIRSCNYVPLWFRITQEYYGGQVSWFYMRGGTSAKTDNTIGVWLWDNRVILPLSNYPKLYGLWLRGTLTPVQ
jgi:hypothetical protein